MEIGRELGFRVKFEDGINGGRIDVVWYYDLPLKISQFNQEIPIMGFEIEAAWRTEKTIKGDFANLFILNPIYGIILFIGEGYRHDYPKGFRLENNLKYAKKIAEKFKNYNKFLIWTEKDVDEIYDILFKEKNKT